MVKSWITFPLLVSIKVYQGLLRNTSWDRRGTGTGKGYIH